MKSYRYSRRIFLFAALWTICGCASGSTAGDTETDSQTASDPSPSREIILQDKNNYTFESRLTLPAVETAGTPDIDICWENLTRDFQCHAVDPLADIDNLAVIRVSGMTEQEIADALAEGELTQNKISGYLDYPPDKETPCAHLNDFTFRGSAVDVSEEYAPSETDKYLLVLTTGMRPGVGARMMTFLTPTAASKNKRVDVESGCDALEFSANLSDLTPVVVPDDGDFTLDWSEITRNGQGGGVSFGGIDEVMLGFYENGTPAELEEGILDLVQIADRTWRIPVESGFSVRMTEAKDADGNRFDGFSGDGAWIVALTCSTCQNPAPQFLTLLTPVAVARDTDSETDSDMPEDLGPALFTHLNATPSQEMPTVIRVRWTTERAVRGKVQFGTDDALPFETPLESEPTETHETLLVGVTPNTEIRYRLVAEDDTGTVQSNLLSVSTGNLPSSPPDFTVEGTGPGFILVSILGTEGAGVTILNAEGEPVWYLLDDRELDVFRVRLSADGRRILYNAASVSGNPSEASELVSISLDGREVDRIPVPLLAHDFVELPGGSIGALTAEYRTVDGEEIMGNQIVEVTADGEISPIWSTWDCFDPAETRATIPTQGWTFANALDFDPAEDAYYIGFHSFSSIAKVDRASGACLWVFGNTAETVGFATGVPRFLHQHQFQVLPDDRILVFDNEGALGNVSRVVEYALDFDAGTASLVWEYTTEPPVYSFVLGEPIRLEDESTFINWSAAGLLTWVAPEGTLRFQLNAPVGNAFGFNTLETSLYRN